MKTGYRQTHTLTSLLLELHVLNTIKIDALMKMKISLLIHPNGQTNILTDLQIDIHTDNSKFGGRCEITAFSHRPSRDGVK